MKKAGITLILMSLMICACDGLKQKTKESINKGGEVVGKTATEFIEGVTEGVDKTLQCELSLSEDLLEKGLQTGKFSIESDSLGGKNNLLTLYLIFNKDFSSTIVAKVYDKNGLEIGRAKLAILGRAGDAGYYDFVFDKRTYIEVRSKITFE
jgi:hypothetical protein